LKILLASLAFGAFGMMAGTALTLATAGSRDPIVVYHNGAPQFIDGECAHRFGVAANKAVDETQFGNLDGCAVGALSAD